MSTSDEVEGGNIIGYISNSQLFLPVCAQASYLGVEVGGGGTLSPSRSRGVRGERERGKGTQLRAGTNSLRRKRLDRFHIQLYFVKAT